MLKNFKLVDTEGKTGVFYKGRTIPFDKIDDAKAEELLGKTHMIERLPETAPVAEPLPALPEASASEQLPAALPEVTDKKKKNKS